MITVRDYADPDQPIRDYSSAAGRWPLAVRRDTLVATDPELTTVQLDLLVKLDDGQMVAVVPRRDLVEHFGVQPVLGIEVRAATDPIVPLSLIVRGAEDAITLAAGTIVADMVILAAQSMRLIPDPDLDLELRPSGAAVFSEWDARSDDLNDPRNW